MLNRKRILRGAIIAAGVAIALPVLFGSGPDVGSERKGEDPLRTLIFEFQTLIGGALAVCAAWWTVKTMEDTETAAAKRHAEQLELVLRKDRLAVERAVNPQRTSLDGQACFLNSFRERMLKETTYDAQLSLILEDAWMLTDLAASLMKMLDLEQVKEGSKLFDGHLAFKLTWLRDQAEDILNVLGNIPTRVFAPQISAMLSNLYERQRLNRIYGTILAVADELPVVASLLEETAERYGV